MTTISISRWTDWNYIVSAAKSAGGNADKHCSWLGLDENNDQNAILSYDENNIDSNSFESAFLNQDFLNLKKAADLKNIQYMRKSEYPPIEEYLDGVVKGDQEQIDNYIAKCLAIKAKYPKVS